LLKVDPKIVNSGADPALLINSKDTEQEIGRAGARKGKAQKTICLAPRLLHFYTNKNFLEKLCSLLPIDTRIRYHLIPRRFFERKKRLVADLAYIADSLAKKRYKVVLLPMYSGRVSPHDEVLCSEIKAKMKYYAHAKVARGDLTISEIIEILKGCDLVIAMPLHTLILSTMHNTPAIAINYQTKGQRFMESIGQSRNSYYLRDILQEVPKRNVLSRADVILSEAAQTRTELRRYIINERKKAIHNFHLVESYIASHENK